MNTLVFLTTLCVIGGFSQTIIINPSEINCRGAFIYDEVSPLDVCESSGGLDYKYVCQDNTVYQNIYSSSNRQCTTLFDSQAVDSFALGTFNCSTDITCPYYIKTEYTLLDSTTCEIDQTSAESKALISLCQDVFGAYYRKYDCSNQILSESAYTDENCESTPSETKEYTNNECQLNSFNEMVYIEFECDSDDNQTSNSTTSLTTTTTTTTTTTVDIDTGSEINCRGAYIYGVLYPLDVCQSTGYDYKYVCQNNTIYQSIYASSNMQCSELFLSQPVEESGIGSFNCSTDIVCPYYIQKEYSVSNNITCEFDQSSGTSTAQTTLCMKMETIYRKVDCSTETLSEKMYYDENCETLIVTVSEYTNNACQLNILDQMVYIEFECSDNNTTSTKPVTTRNELIYNDEIDCKGVVVDGLLHPIDVCMNMLTDGISESTKFVCLDNNIYVELYSGSDCDSFSRKLPVSITADDYSANCNSTNICPYITTTVYNGSSINDCEKDLNNYIEIKMSTLCIPDENGSHKYTCDNESLGHYVYSNSNDCSGEYDYVNTTINNYCGINKFAIYDTEYIELNCSNGVITTSSPVVNTANTTDIITTKSNARPSIVFRSILMFILMVAVLI